jgi:quinol monooxygenase YgiN
MEDIVLLVELKLHPGKRAAYVARARRHRERVLANEADCRRFDVLIPEDCADTVHLCEVYADHAAFERHLQTPYMKAYMADTAPMIAERKRVMCRLANET